MERRLAAILAIDMVGYSRLMAADEVGTLARQKQHRLQVIEVTVAQYGGRIVKSTGDGALAEFPSIVATLRAAVTIQRMIAEREAAFPEEKRIAYRIGINLGDIIVEDGDIYGDGVNVAARLEALAEPGGICVSRTVVNHVRGRVASDFQDLGEQQVKNIPKPVHVFRVLMAPEEVGESPVGAKASRWRGRVAAAVAAGALLLAMAAIGAAVWQPWVPAVEPASESEMAFPLPELPSIAVLPFDNLSGDPAQEPFADGITDDLITDLSKVSGLFVISRNSTFVYKAQAVEIRRVAEALGVRYVLEGSVQRAGDTIRLNAQLIDATSGGHVWAERYDGNVGDIFGVQDHFVRQIVQALQVNLAPREAQEISLGRTDHVAAREAFQRGWEHYLQFNAGDNSKAIPYLKKAIELDPDYGRAYALLSLAYFRITHFTWGAEGRSASTISLTNRQAYEAGLRYLEVARQHPTALLHVALSLYHLIDSRHAEAHGEAAQAIAADHNEPEAHIVMVWVLITEGEPDEALQEIDRAMRLNPNYPSHYVWTRGVAYFAKSDFQQAAKILRQRLEREAEARELAPLLAAAYALVGRREEARAALQLWLPLRSQQQLSNIPDTFVLRFFRGYQYEAVRERLYDGLQIAALPLEVTVTSLVETLRGDNYFERLAALKTLGHFGPMAEPAVPALIAALDEGEEAEVRRRAVLALAKIGPAANEALPALKAMEGEPALRIYVKNAIQRIAED